MVAIGAPSKSSGSGFVYLYSYDQQDETWKLNQTLSGTASFGTSLAVDQHHVSGTRKILVGVPADSQAKLFEMAHGVHQFSLIKTLQGQAGTLYANKVALTSQYAIVAEPTRQYACPSGPGTNQIGSLAVYSQANSYDLVKRVEFACQAGDSPQVGVGLGVSDLTAVDSGSAVRITTGLPGRNQGRGAVLENLEIQQTGGTYTVQAGTEKAGPAGSLSGFGNQVRHIPGHTLATDTTGTLLDRTQYFQGKHSAFLSTSTFAIIHEHKAHIYTFDGSQRVFKRGVYKTQSGWGHHVTEHFGRAMDGMMGYDALAVGDSEANKVYITVPKVIATYPSGSGWGHRTFEFPVYQNWIVERQNPGFLGFQCERCIDSTHTFSIVDPATANHRTLGSTTQDAIYPSITMTGLSTTSDYKVHYSSPWDKDPVFDASLKLKEYSDPLVQSLSLAPMGNIAYRYGKVKVSWTGASTNEENWGNHYYCLATVNPLYVHYDTCMSSSQSQGDIELPTKLDMTRVKMSSDQYMPVALSSSSSQLEKRVTLGSGAMSLVAPSFVLTGDAAITFGGRFDIEVKTDLPEGTHLSYNEKYVEAHIIEPLLGHKTQVGSRFSMPGHLTTSVPTNLPTPKAGEKWYLQFSYSQYPEAFFKRIPFTVCYPTGSTASATVSPRRIFTKWNYACPKPTRSSLYLSKLDSAGQPIPASIVTVFTSAVCKNFTYHIPSQFEPGMYRFEWSMYGHGSDYKATTPPFEVTETMIHAPEPTPTPGVSPTPLPTQHHPSSSAWVIAPVLGGVAVVAAVAVVLTIVLARVYMRKQMGATRDPLLGGSAA